MALLLLLLLLGSRRGWGLRPDCGCASGARRLLLASTCSSWRRRRSRTRSSNRRRCLLLLQRRGRRGRASSCWLGSCACTSARYAWSWRGRASLSGGRRSCCARGSSGSTCCSHWCTRCYTAWCCAGRWWAPCCACSTSGSSSASCSSIRLLLRSYLRLQHLQRLEERCRIDWPVRSLQRRWQGAATLKEGCCCCKGCAVDVRRKREGSGGIAVAASGGSSTWCRSAGLLDC